jgi:mersacidin/lichenicidin family type 2 lantibiotic
MSNVDVVRAWKDKGYRASLSPEELAALPPNPAGPIEISDEDLGNVAGGNLPYPTVTCTLGDICTSYFASCVWTCGCTPGCFPRPPMMD